MEEIQRYILTGGPGCGKTWVAGKLQEKGLRVIEEQARLVIKEEMEKGTDYLPWKDIQTFSSLVFNRFSREYGLIKNSKEIVFSDRGPLDIFGYLQVNKQNWDTGLLENALKLNFNTTVFFFPPWKEIYKQDKERIESFEAGVQIANALREVYMRFGFQLVEIPFIPLEERVEFILNEIK